MTMSGEAKRCSFLALLWAAISLGSAGWAGAARAEPRVLVVEGKGVSADVRRAVDAAVVEVAEPVETRAYHAQARARGLASTSDAALREVAPKLGVSLIVVTRRERGKLVLSFHDGGSAALVGEERFELPRRGKPPARLVRQLSAAVKRALVGGAPAPPPAAADEQPEREEPEEPEDAEVPRPPAAEAQPEQEAPLTAEPESAPEPSAVVEPSEHLRLSLSVGPGAAVRELEVPTRVGLRKLATGVYPGLALSITVHGMLGEHFRLAASGDYRTSLGLEGVESPPLGATRESSLRSHSLSFGLAPGYRFGAADSVVLQLFVGWIFQGLRAVVDEAFPSLSWHGAVIRPELIIPFGDRVTLRVAPELVAVAGIYTTLVGRTGLAGSGIGLGGELALDVRLSAWLSLGFDYRESHMSLGSSWGANLSDVLRFGSVRLNLRY